MDGPRLRFLEWSILLWTSASVVVGFVVSLISREYFHDVFAAEDHYIENMTVVSLLGAFLVCAHRVYRIGRSRGAVFLAVGMLSALLFAFGAGEELSWGQRLRRWEVLEFAGASTFSLIFWYPANRDACTHVG